MGQPPSAAQGNYQQAADGAQDLRGASAAAAAEGYRDGLFDLIDQLPSEPRYERRL